VLIIIFLIGNFGQKAREIFKVYVHKIFLLGSFAKVYVREMQN